MNRGLRSENVFVHNYMQALAGFMLVATVTLVWAANSSTQLACVCAGGLVLGPPALAWSRRARFIRQRNRREEMLVHHTMAYLRQEELSAPPPPAAHAGFRDLCGSLVRRPPTGEMLVYDFIPAWLRVARPMLPRFGLVPVYTTRRTNLLSAV